MINDCCAFVLTLQNGQDMISQLYCVAMIVYIFRYLLPNFAIPWLSPPARAGPDSVTRTRGGPGTVHSTPQQIGMFDFSTLPSLVFEKLLRFLSPEFRDVRNLSYVSSDMRERVLAYLDILYTRHLHLDNSTRKEGVDLTKPILSLKLTCSADLLLCPCPNIDSHALFLKQIGSIDLSNLKSLV